MQSPKWETRGTKAIYLSVVLTLNLAYLQTIQQCGKIVKKRPKTQSPPSPAHANLRFGALADALTQIARFRIGPIRQTPRAQTLWFLHLDHHIVDLSITHSEPDLCRDGIHLASTRFNKVEP